MGGRVEMFGYRKARRIVSNATQVFTEAFPYSTLIRRPFLIKKRMSLFTDLHCFFGWFWRARTKLKMQLLVLSEYSLSVQSPNGLRGLLAATTRYKVLMT